MVALFLYRGRLYQIEGRVSGEEASGAVKRDSRSHQMRRP
jgi:hypothetical protein